MDRSERFAFVEIHPIDRSEKFRVDDEDVLVSRTYWLSTPFAKFRSQSHAAEAR